MTNEVDERPCLNCGNTMLILISPPSQIKPGWCANCRNAYYIALLDDGLV